MNALIEPYIARFGVDKLPTLFGMDEELATKLLSEALVSDKALTPERLKELGVNPPPAGAII